jgi:4-alpha-glucanotransferase
MRLPRAAGILLHPTSLPGRFGIGDLGPAAFEFVDLLKRAGQSYWQMLPLGPVGYGDSPYSSISAFAGNVLLISPEKLVEANLISENDLHNAAQFAANRVDYSAVGKWKLDLLTTAYKAFRSSDVLKVEFDEFCSNEKSWLDDLALFLAIRDTQNGHAWFDWPEKFKLRDQRTIEIAREQLNALLDKHKFYQFLFFSQWHKLRSYANENDVKLIGDMPIFAALDSADVWNRRSQFKLDNDGSPKVVAGVPPDYFSKTGQLWGNPIYNWDAMRADGFSWWTARFRNMLTLVDVVRVDHFRGFSAVWEVPGGDKTAENGQWTDVPGRELFAAVESALGSLPVIAEDLGVMTSDVEELRDAFDFPGMRILQYGFSGDAKNRDLPHNYIQNTAAYTGTHDNETTLGWWNSIDKTQRDHCLKYLGANGSEINWDMMRAVYSSVADTAIVPLQDVLGLGNDARMNTPATSSGNWKWRFQTGAITPETVLRLRELAELYGRI